LSNSSLVDSEYTKGEAAIPDDVAGSGEANAIPECQGDMTYSRQTTVKNLGRSVQIAIEERSIKIMTKACEKALEAKPSLAELFLSLASLFLGAFVSAIISGVSYKFDLWSIIFYNACPALGIGCFVAWLFKRKQENADAVGLANLVLECITPDQQSEE